MRHYNAAIRGPVCCGAVCAAARESVPAAPDQNGHVTPARSSRRRTARYGVSVDYPSPRGGRPVLTTPIRSSTAEPLPTLQLTESYRVSPVYFWVCVTPSPRNEPAPQSQ